MATPMTADQRVAAFRAEGLRVVELPGWRTNNRAGHGAWGPWHGMVNHHTGSDVDIKAQYDYANGVLSDGYSTLLGPLCQEGLGTDATLYMVGNGRCNHAGGGDPAVLAAVINDAVPMDRELRPAFGNSTPGKGDGNAPFTGLEVMYSGGHAMTPEQYLGMVRWNVAQCRFAGWSGASAIGHREWSRDKVDPGVVFMPHLRKDIDAALALPPGVWGRTTPTPVPAPTPAPVPVQEDDMFTDADRAMLQAITNQELGYGRRIENIERIVGDVTNQELGYGNRIENIERMVGDLQQAVKDALAQKPAP
jgi:hypothetical protein